ncbi:MAG: hypothetical protein M3Z25_12415 [Actinomycetota bacterium]|nr:hypothetical protein [Actinomycetota bacterium]
MSGLESRQRALVAALVAGGAIPDGLDPVRLSAAERALRAKRAGEVAGVWPLLAVTLGFDPRFADWAVARPSHGALRDGWDFARELAAADRLPELARLELAGREVLGRYDGQIDPRPRRLPAVRRVPGGWVIGLLGRVCVFAAG